MARARNPSKPRAPNRGTRPAYSLVTMKIKQALITLLFLFTLPSCVLQPEDRAPEVVVDNMPRVRVVSDSGVYFGEYLDGAALWSPLGFTFVLGTGAPADLPALPECAYEWYAQDDRVNCQITVTIVVDPQLIEKWKSDGVAYHEARTVALDDSIWVDGHSSEYLQHVVAHEFGHILLAAGNADHTPTGLLSGDGSLTMSEDDYDVACRIIGVCL